MKNIEKLESLVPMEEIEVGAQDQIRSVLELDFVKKLAIMPDVHCGYTLPIGGVALTEGVVSPEFVGVDQGCGVCCVVTNLKAHKYNKNKLTKIREKIVDAVPVGFNCHKEAREYVEFNGAGYEFNDLISKPKQKLNHQRINDKALVQLGTMGGGNHFLEVGVNKDGYISVVIHSGSRNIGHQIASFYIALSKVVDVDLPNGFFHLEGKYGQAYLKDLLYAQNYALANRKEMMKSVLSVLGLELDDFDMINENHNHAVVLDGGMVIHRKGATPADKGQMGLIPINSKDGTYITVGLGNEKYLSSASHGAGRKMGRKVAKKTLSMEKYKKHMKGIICDATRSNLDESPDAYKDGDTVIAYQEGVVVDVIDHIKPLISVKG